MCIAKFHLVRHVASKGVFAAIPLDTVGIANKLLEYVYRTKEEPFHLTFKTPNIRSSAWHRGQMWTCAFKSLNSLVLWFTNFVSVQSLLNIFLSKELLIVYIVVFISNRIAGFSWNTLYTIQRSYLLDR